MSRNIMTLACLAAVLVLIAASLTFAQGQQRNLLPDAQYTDGGTEACTRCHGGERMLIVADSVHGNLDNPDTPFAMQGCESCHGPGSLHVSRARGGIGFPAMLAFNEEEPVARHTDACMGCHAEDMGELPGMHWVGSVHDVNDNTCINCHQVHTLDGPLTERVAQTELCSGCHDDEIRDHRRFEDKGIVFDQLTCYDCHDVHQLMREP